jgi:hypothetical protein
LFDLFGVELLQFTVARAGAWFAPVKLLEKAQAAVVAFRDGNGGDPALLERSLPVAGLRVPYAQDQVDADRAVLYKALALDTIDLVLGAPGGQAAVVTTVMDHVDAVRAQGLRAVHDPEWHPLLFSAIGLLAHYAGGPPPIIQALARFCGVPYCQMVGRAPDARYWVAALDGAAMLASARALGLLTD